MVNGVHHGGIQIPRVLPGPVKRNTNGFTFINKYNKLDVLSIQNNQTCIDCAISLVVIFIKHFTAQGTVFSVGQSTVYSIPQDPLQYDSVLVNDGGIWNPVSSSYVIPQNGTYLFCIGTTADAASPSRNLVRVDGVTGITARAENQEYSTPSSAGINLVTRVTEGSTVHVKVTKGGYSESNLTTTFGLYSHLYQLTISAANLGPLFF